MKVIFAGQAGVAKDAAMRRIAEHARAERGWHDDLSRTEHKAHILPIVFEDEIVREHSSITTVLDSFNNQLRAALWHEAFAAVNQRIQRAEPDHVFLSIHLSLYRHSNFFTFTDWDELRRFEPDLLITLIDDVYDVWARIRQKTREAEDRTLITLKELFAWRSVECFFAEQLSRNLCPNRRVPHYVVAVKHPLRMFDHLIFEPRKPRIYASYPISRVRDDAPAVQEINHARERLHREFTVFDPVTIDERILRKKLETASAGTNEVCIELSNRWPINWDDCAANPSELYPLRLPSREIEALGTFYQDRWRWQDIDDNIRWRDFTLINQSQGVLAYRPRFGNQELSRGVTRELIYALDVRVIPCHIYSPPDDGDLDTSPFVPSGVIDANFDEAVANLKSKLTPEGG